MNVIENLKSEPAATGRESPKSPLSAPSAPGGGPKLSAKERFVLLEQFATLIDSGIQIPAALQSMRQQCSQPRIAAALAQLEHGVVGGQPLSAAMAEMPRSFPPLLTQMVRAGETTGALGDMLRRTVDMMEREAVLRSKMRSAMLYPGVMLLLTVAVVTFLLVFIVPKFERMFRGKDLPTPTRILMNMGEFATTYGLWVLAGLVVAGIAAWMFVRTSRGVRVVDAILLRIPVLGSMYSTSILARSVQTLGMLVESGVPVHTALEHTQQVAASPSYSDMWRQARQQVVNGGSLLDGIRGNRLVAPTFEQVVAAGEATASLDRVMLKTASQFTRELERKIRDLLTLVEPIMVVMMGGVVGFIALSIMMPIFRMSRG